MIAEFSRVMDVVRAIRNLRAERRVKPGRRIPAILVSQDDVHVLRDQSPSLATLAHLDPEHLLIIEQLDQKPERHIALVVGSVEIYLPLADLIDPAEERARLSRELEAVEEQIQRLDTLLQGPFSRRAPAEVIQKERDNLASYQDTADKLRNQIKAIQ